MRRAISKRVCRHRLYLSLYLFSGWPVRRDIRENRGNVKRAPLPDPAWPYLRGGENTYCPPSRNCCTRERAGSSSSGIAVTTPYCIVYRRTIELRIADDIGPYRATILVHCLYYRKKTHMLAAYHETY